MRRTITHKAGAQALVEFTLAATLIFFLLAAAVDLGLIFFSLQNLRTAAQEGATFGSRPITFKNARGGTERVDIDYANVTRRILNANGTDGQNLGNVRDLNNDDTDDLQQIGSQVNGANSSGDDFFRPSYPGETVNFIEIENLQGVNPDNLSGTACLTDTQNAGLRGANQNCWIRVTLRYRYRFIFPLAPAFGNEVILSTRYTIRMRSTFIG
jgi:TadE-like protein